MKSPPTSDPAAAEVFERLRAEEGGHKARFERLYDDDIMGDN